MENFNKSKWEDLNLTVDELKNIGEALQKEEFRNLLLEYVKEINDPENRKQYEKEITELEKERGVDVKFVHPSSGYVIKTSVDGKNKAFINVCSNANIGVPSSTPKVEQGQEGLQWSIPYCLAPSREDIDKKKNTCIVYDVVFHPDTLHLANKNEAFKKLVNDTAIEGIEANFNVFLDKINLKFPNMHFKGLKRATVIRKRIDHFQQEKFIDIPNYPYKIINEETQNVSKTFQRKTDVNESSDIKANIDTQYTKPMYIIKHSKKIDMQDYTEDPGSTYLVTVPNELLIIIHLPLLKSSTNVNIDVTEKTFFLLSETPVKYKLYLKLPYTVDSIKGNAKFDSVTRKLTITLPVVKQKFYFRCDTAREDSGVESDNCLGRSSSLSSEDEFVIRRSPRNEVSENEIDSTNVSYESVKKGQLANSATNSHVKKRDVHYTIPNYSCRLLNNDLIFTLYVSNVNPEIVENSFLSNFKGFYLSFQSVGPGFFPVDYAICVSLPGTNKIKTDTFSVEVWDKMVITQVKLLSSDTTLSHFYIGTDETNFKKHILQASELKACGKIEEEENENKLALKISIEKAKEINKLIEEDKDVCSFESGSSFDESVSSPCHQPVKSRTISESHEEDIMRSKRRGILKIGRSLSESSAEDYASWSNIKEEKAKKTVRFSEVISKQTFRMNSSILGQRKKNQRKMRNKKRAQERRLSESGGESEGESETALFKGKNSDYKKELDIWIKETESSSCDASEVSEVSDISESDDCQKIGIKPLTPCSNRRNHKRRGKKSARKNAATAKFQFLDN